MSLATRSLGLTRDVARELGMVVPRTVAGLNESTGWAPATPRGVRQFGEVMLDELVLSGFSLLGGTPKAIRSPDACSAAAEELSALGIDRAHADPEPLQVQTTQRRRIAGLAYERLTFEHDPALPKTLAAEGLGGPARAVVHLCRHTDGPRPWLVWVHGAGQGGAEDLLLTRIGRIHHAAGVQRRDAGAARPRLPASRMAGLPGHGSAGQRRGHDARGVGGTSRRQMGPAASQRRCGVRDFDGHPGGRAGVAPGAARSTRLALYTPILGLNAMIARHLGRWGSSRDVFRELLGSPVVSQLTSVIDPLAVDPAPPPQRRLIVGAWHDRMAMREPTTALQDRWGGQLYWYDGSHVGHIFSRRVQRVTERFLRDVEKL